MKKVPLPIVLKEKAKMPLYATEQAAGADLHAYIEKDIVLSPGQSVLVPTGISVIIPENFELQIRPRSGLALHHQITVLNTPGTIDSDYRGEIGVVLINHGSNPFVITPHMRIAQAVLAPVYKAEFTVQTELSSSTRGGGGFGHSGLH
ncbi:MAG: dUTP diphosphatase [Parachlamydiales bacterium]|nr:dUTP diphosphatase [Parachlamydiales bacterium]